MDGPCRKTLVEIWQANAAGRYLHKRDQHEAPLDPNFSGQRHALTDDEGRYRFVTCSRAIIRGAIITTRGVLRTFISRCLVRRLRRGLVTQMYFPGDPLLPFDPIFNCTADEKARQPADFSFRLGDARFRGTRWDINLT